MQKFHIGINQESTVMWKFKFAAFFFCFVSILGELVMTSLVTKFVMRNGSSFKYYKFFGQFSLFS